VRRLFCCRFGQTVSLLPDFCLPGRQHGPAIAGRFFQALVKGGTLTVALLVSRGKVPSHSVAQDLYRGLLRKSDLIRLYLSGVHPRAVEPPAGIRGRSRRLYSLVVGLLTGFGDEVKAFSFHARRFHRCFQTGLI